MTLGRAERALLKRAADRFRLSARSTLRVLKVARTIADLAASDHVVGEHVAEALQLRCRDRDVAGRDYQGYSARNAASGSTRGARSAGK